VSGQQHALAALYPGKDPAPIVQEAGWAPGLVWTGGKSRSTGIRSLTVQPVVSHYTHWATQPRYYFNYKVKCTIRQGLCYVLDNQGIMVQFLGGARDYLPHSTASKLALWPTQTPIPWASRDHSSKVNRLQHESNHSPPHKAYVKNEWRHTSLHPPSKQRAMGQICLHFLCIIGYHTLIK